MRAPLLLVALLLLALNPSCGTSKAGLTVIKLEIDGHKLSTEVARAPEEQSRGLMYRRKLGKNDAMLFVYEKPSRLSFWMKNTFVPLSIAFIDGDHRIVHIEDMAPQTTTSHRSSKPALYALEVNRGWFDERGITVGAKVEFELPATAE